MLNVAICFLNVHGLHLGWGGDEKRVRMGFYTCLHQVH